MSDITFAVKCPVCDLGTTFSAPAVLPRSAHLWYCRRCRTSWDVSIKRLGERPGARVDSVTWWDRAGRDYQQEYAGK